jgi:hypothetical protein
VDVDIAGSRMKEAFILEGSSATKCTIVLKIKLSSGRVKTFCAMENATDQD